MARRSFRFAAGVLMSAALLLDGAGCGGGSKSAAASSSGTATSGATSATTSSQSSVSKPAAAQPAGLRASLHGDNHAPKVGKLWHYVVLASDASGRPLTGTVDSEFVFGGQIVGRETPPAHPLKHGRLTDKFAFPARAVGFPLTFRVVVHTHLGSVTLNWPIQVTR